MRFQVPLRPLGPKDIIFNVRADGGKFGELRISKGAIVWVPADAKVGYRIGWGTLDSWMRDFGSKHRPKF